MTYRQMICSGLLALILLALVLDLNWRWQLTLFNALCTLFAFWLGRMKPAIVRIVQYPPHKGIDITDEMNRAMDLTPGRKR